MGDDADTPNANISFRRFDASIVALIISQPIFTVGAFFMVCLLELIPVYSGSLFLL